MILMMRKFMLKHSWLYRYRYWWSIICLALFALTMIFSNLDTMPNGLSAAEEANVAHVSSIKPAILYRDSSRLNYVANWPWTAAEVASTQLLGRSVFAWRLPAAILALVTIGVMMALIWRMRKPSLAVIAGFLMASSAGFLCLGREATPVVMTACLLSIALYNGYLVLNHTLSKWRLRLARWCLVIVLALLPYLTGGFLAVVVLLLATLAHPRGRLLFKEHKGAYLAYLVTGVVLWLPWFASLAMDILHGGKANLVSQMLLLPSHNLVDLGGAVMAVLGFIHLKGAPYLLPVGLLTLVDTALAIWGIWVLASHFASVRSRLILLLFAAFLQPAMVALLFIPLTLLVVLGLGDIIDRWYTLFPRNPYARTFALIPLSALIISLGWFNSERYFAALNYHAPVVYSYNEEYQTAYQLSKDRSIEVLVVPDDKIDLYYAVQSHHHVTVVGASAADQLRMSDFKDNSKMAVLGSANFRPDEKQLKERSVLAGWRKNHPVLARIYYGDAQPAQSAE